MVNSNHGRITYCLHNLYINEKYAFNGLQFRRHLSIFIRLAIVASQICDITLNF